MVAPSFMTTNPHRLRTAVLQMQMSEFWSGDLGLTLVTISLVILIFLVTPLLAAGLPGRIFFDFMMATLMILGALNVEKNRAGTAVIIAFVLLTAVTLGTSRIHPTPFLHRFGSVLSTITLLIYIRIVLLLMFRGGPVTWSRIQGGVSAYLLLGMAWASAFQVVEELRPGAFHFVNAAADIDQLDSKLLYFSFCTLTTVGSEITPMIPFARSLTIAEAICGQLFPAILIGALVAMAMQSQHKSA
jgi:Ion channel